MRQLLRPTATGLAIAIACAACTGRDATPADTAAPSTVAAPATTAMPAEPATTMPAPSATAMPPASTTSAAPPATGPTPAAGAIAFNGFGPAHWGASEEQVRQAWGKDMEGAPSEPNGCYYLFPAPREAGGFRLAFMMEAGKLSRIDVRTADVVAPGGGKVGMTRAELHALYKGLAEQKDKYDENAVNLRAMDPDGGQGVAVFATGASGKVTAWRVGVPPQVDYVEGCS